MGRQHISEDCQSLYLKLKSSECNLPSKVVTLVFRSDCLGVHIQKGILLARAGCLYSLPKWVVIIDSNKVDF